MTATLTHARQQILRAVRACENERTGSSLRRPDIVPVSAVCRYVDYRIHFVADQLRDLAECGYLERVAEYPLKGYRLTVKGCEAVPLQRSYHATITSPDVLDAATLELIAALVNRHTSATIAIHPDMSEF